MQREHKCEMVVELTDEKNEQVEFAPADNDGDLYSELTLDWDVWVRMGRPNRVDMTITVPEPDVEADDGEG